MDDRLIDRVGGCVYEMFIDTARTIHFPVDRPYLSRGTVTLRKEVRCVIALLSVLLEFSCETMSFFL